MDDTIRHPLAAARAARGWSQSELARRIGEAARARGLRSGIDRHQIWKWENYRAVPGRESQLLLADVFGTDPALVEALGWPFWLPGPDRPVPLGPGSAVPALQQALGESMDRRAFLTATTATAVTGLAQQWAAATPAHALPRALDGHSVGHDLVTRLETIGDQLTGLVTEQRQHTRALLDGHLSTVTDLLHAGNHPPDLGRRLHTLAARLALTSGWIRFDQAHHAAASRYWQAALHSAHASGDRDLGAGIIADLSYQALWTGDPRTAADLLTHALTHTRHPTARSLLQLRLARAHAALGDTRPTDHALTQAEYELDRTTDQAPPPWCSWMGPADLLVDAGRCHLDLGRTTRAHQLIGEGTALLTAARAKTRGVFLAYEAENHLRTGDVDQAAAAATESLTLARRIGAPRCVTLVEQLLPAFRDHPRAPGVPELLHLARSA
ncbi:helix-turn-helix transcriptional regulator [Streptomyces sp. NPDC057638]|uniref:helix-turn-helix transcriptional regulator n=1 Tax=Streptomyces sp. NPDC057638 TaxID=3346190 RepID=UPI0036A8A4AA